VPIQQGWESSSQPVVPGRLATYGARLGGWILDWILLAAVTVPLLYVTHSIHRTYTTVIINGVDVRETRFHPGLGGLALQAVIIVGYGAILCGGKRGQTVGMMVAGVRAVDQDKGGPIGFARALGRAAFEYLMAVLLFFPWVIDMLFPIWDSSNQTLHDKVTKTVVIKV
jgi:uncharacterized RDD family membrane protein YckC